MVLCYSPRKLLQMVFDYFKFICSFFQSDLLSTYYMPGTLLGITEINKTLFLPSFLEFDPVEKVAL